MNLREFLARCLAARKMGLIKDKRGIWLPDVMKVARKGVDRNMPEVDFILEAIQQYELAEIVRRYHEAENDE